ncbi:VENN motif pre-toxin domain-containing protein, partial [Gilliamella sp. wkB171]|uniref:VENN motif pre-toxin domain-containing protein n=1 Tax=Gilliamella sp. wkB171 TaxID=3120258 RepID=UPI0015CF0994
GMSAMGSNTRQGIDMAINIINGLITGDMTGAVAGALAPKLATIIKQQTGDNKVANTISHAILGAVVAELQGNSAVVGGVGAAVSERGAEVIASILYPNKSIDELNQDEKQQVSALAQLATGLTIAALGGDAQDINTAIAGGKNAVENNYLNSSDHQDKVGLEYREGEGKLTEEEKQKLMKLQIKNEESTEALLKACVDVNSEACSIERQKAYDALKTYVNYYYNQLEYQAGYLEIKHLLEGTSNSSEANQLRMIYEGYVESYKRFGYDEEDARNMAGRTIGTMIIVHGISGNITLPALNRVFNGSKLLNAGKGTTLPNGYTPQGTNVVGPRGGVYTNTGKVDAAGNPIYTNNGAYYTFENGAKTKVPSPNTNTSSQVQQNYQQGKQYEQTKYDEFSSTQEKSAREVTLETENGTKIRLDMIGKDKNGNITCIECKSSDKATLTPNQKVGFPDLEKNGGTIIGDGKPGFEGGTKIPPTKVEVVRPDN